MACNVLIADDMMTSREVLEHAVRSCERYELVRICASADEALAYLKSHAVDLVILDILMEQGQSGLSVAEEIRKRLPDTKIILVTSMPEAGYIERAKRIGADSFWYKEVREQPILAVMDKTMDGEHIFPDHPPVLQIGGARSTEFTEREIEVLRELVDGASNKQIAELLCISEKTVKMHITNMLQKTGFQSRLELAVKARQRGFVIHD